VPALSSFASRFLYQNPLHLNVFTEAIQLESEAIAMVASVLGGGVGVLTCGWAENVADVLMAAKETARGRRVARPNMCRAY
jgi:glutamate/tyrosine decarboxylase-like PLP-dependent enzyme